MTGPTAAAAGSRSTHSAAVRVAKIAAQLLGQRGLPCRRRVQPLDEIGAFERLAQRAPGARLGGGNGDELAVGRPVGTPVGRLAPARLTACGDARHRLTDDPGGGVVDADVDEATHAGAVAAATALRMPTTATSAPYGTASTKSGVGGTVSPAMSAISPEYPRKLMSCAARSA